MKVGEAGINAHLLDTVTTLADCVRVDLRNGAQYGFTSHDVDILYGGDTYERESSFNRTAIQQRTDLDISNLDLMGLVDSVQVTKDDLIAGLYNSAEVYFFVINWADVSDGILKMQRGYISDIVHEDGGLYKAQLLGLPHRLNDPILNIYKPECDYDLGVDDGKYSRCGFDLSTVIESGTVVSVTNRRSFLAEGITNTDDYFNLGRVLWTSGDNSGLYMKVKDSSDSLSLCDLKLYLPEPFDIQVGDTFNIWPGCDGRLVTCQGFDQVINFGGFPTVEGNRNMIRIPSRYSLA